MRAFLLLIITFVSLNVAFAQQQTDVFYEIFVRSFQDTNNDGIGDLNGVTQRLDYLASLGVTGIWLMPVHPSPSYHGYDVTDYYDIHPDYGTLEDMQTLIDKAHENNIKIILDLVVNHTSDQHSWFQAASQNDPVFTPYYSWVDAIPDPDWRSLLGGSAWHENNDRYYLGLFGANMPDLNYRNPAVMFHMKDVAKYWLDKGIDGFRIDAIQHITESSNGDTRNTPETLEWVREFEAFIKSVNEEAFLLGETWTEAPAIAAYHANANLDVSLNYPLFFAMLGALQQRSATDLRFVLNQDARLYPAGAKQAIFVANHDQVRPASLLGVLKRDESRLKLLAAMNLTLPGIPLLYYGQEIGMPNAEGAQDEAKRTPMRWAGGALAGFSSVEPWQPFSTDDLNISVAAQQAQDDSLLNWYKQLIALRTNNPTLYAGDTRVLSSDQSQLLAFTRAADYQTWLILMNVGTKDLSVDLSTWGFDDAYDLLAQETLGASVTLPGLGVMILDVSH